KNNWFAFGSEIRQLLPLLYSNNYNHLSLLKFIVGSQAEGVENTFFEGVNKLPGGHNMIFNLNEKKLHVERYYELSIDYSLKNIDEEESISLFSNSLTRAINIRLRSDVPVGTCLSGGLDSSSVASLASNSFNKTAQTNFCGITACSEQKDNDETEFAKQVINHNNMTWHRVLPRYEDFVSALPSIVESQEEPFPSASIAMQFFVMQRAKKEKIPVLLDGQGGDEILLGYERYFAAHFLSEINNNGLLGTLKEVFRSSSNNTKMSVYQMLAYFIYFNFTQMRWQNYKYRHSYLRHFPEMFEEVALYAKASKNIDNLQKLEIERTNLPALLRYEDKNAMAHSIETRLPFLDYRLVELCLSLPGSAKISEGWTKHILRKTMYKKMPETIIWRRNKLGFEAPEKIWFNNHRSIMFKNVQNSSIINSLCNKNKLMKNFNSLDTLTQWRLYSIACWEETFNVVT
ncbi:asparagine synthetase B family protein, partial [Alphaproteobacteria bacterium]|nr:asparagine synthetase B family protein [Alphaproteobacteria bacterium]